MKLKSKILIPGLMALFLIPGISIAENQPPMMHNPGMMAMPNMDTQMMQRDQAMQQRRMMQMMRDRNMPRQTMPDYPKGEQHGYYGYGHMPMMMQQRHAMGQAHRAKMEQRLANIEALLQELVNLQKQAK